MAARKRKETSVDCKVTVKLDGWPEERRMLSVIEASWFVNLEFQQPGKNTKVLTYFQSSNYDEALKKYTELSVITET